MVKTRRTSLEVTQAQLRELEQLEKLKAKYEKQLKSDAGKPVHWALIRAIAEVAVSIAAIVKSIKRRSKKRR